MLVLAPGGGSFVELSTSLAEQLASHGFVVVTVQPDAAVETGEDFGPLPEDPAALELLVEVAERQRLGQILDALDLLEDPTTARLVGPIDLARVAVGGHSYGGSTAFNASLVDPRIAAAIDLDGSLFEAAGTTPTTVPSLLLMASMLQLAQRPVEPGEGPDVRQGRLTIEFVRTNPRVVAVGLVGAEHYDVTDVPVIAAALPPGLAEGGPIGPAGTRGTSTIVRRFLDATLGTPSRQPTAAELVEGVASATAELP